METWLIVVIVIVAILILLLAYVFKTYNKLVKLRNRVKDQWSQIDVQLKRRFDLIPNLVNTIKGYAKHESETLEKVIQARNTYLTATTSEEKMAANSELSGMLTKLFALSESYPDLKANTNFLDLQSELQETENKIAMARQFYNDTVLSYNNKVEMIPSNIVASIFHFKTMEYFKVQEEERKNVEVQF